MAVARVLGSSVVPALLVGLVACAAASVAVVAGGTACDGVNCVMGTCKESTPTPLPISPTYECDCYPGWARIIPTMPSLPCYIPTCPSGGSCYIPTFKLPPVGGNVTLHPCLAMDCGPEGTCVEEQDKPFRCQCNPGATNVLKNPSLPCTKNDCVIGEDGCPVQAPPPSMPPQSPLPLPPSSTTPPDVVHGSPGPTAPSSTQDNPTNSTSSPGSIRSPDLLLPLLLLASLYIVS